MAITQTLAAIRALGISARYNPDTKEYRVTYSLKHYTKNQRPWTYTDLEKAEADAYYTNDAADALGTAQLMTGAITFDVMD